MEEKRIEKILKIIFIVLVVLFLIMLCLPYESGSSEGALLRNHIRREKVLPWDVELFHVEDVTLQEGQEQMRAAIFKEKEKYILQWYQMDEEGNYKLIQDAYEQRPYSEKVILFPDLHMNFYEMGYEVYFSEDERTEYITVTYDYKISEGKDTIEEGILEETYPVERNPQLLCIPDNKFDDMGGYGRSVSRRAAAKDAMGNLIK